VFSFIRGGDGCIVLCSFHRILLVLLFRLRCMSLGKGKEISIVYAYPGSRVTVMAVIKRASTTFGLQQHNKPWLPFKFSQNT
jgi:hypothetical protein